jgi:DNA invertase Pin-like site-specific DNA recombinase
MTSTDALTRLDAVQLEVMFHEAAGVATMPEGWTPVGAWIRVSSGSQDEALQVPQVLKYLIEHQYWPVRWYVVHAKSAYHGKHQADLDQAIADMRDGITPVLVIWHSDRLERREGKNSLINTLAEFVDAGGHVESVQEPTLGQMDMGGQVMTFMAGLMNNEKSKHISEQVKQAQDRIRANNGLFGQIPWGYEITGPKYAKTIVPTDECREYVPLIFERCIAGDSLRTIATWLDSEGVLTAKGNHRWNEAVVRGIIRNRTYAGRRLSPEGQTIQTCEKVVDAATFERANQALKTRPKRGPVAATNRPMLANLGCARCGDSPMYRIRAGTYGQYLYYRCAGRGAQRTGCGNMVPYHQTEELIAMRIFMTSNKPHYIRTWVKGVNYESEIVDIKQDIREVTEAERWDELPALTAQLDDYRNRKTKPGYYDRKKTDQTEGEYFYGLSPDERREYLAKEHDIRVEKSTKAEGLPGIHVLIDGEDHGTWAYPPTEKLNAKKA